MRIRRATGADAARLSAIAQQAKAWWGYSAAQMALWRDELTFDAASMVSHQTAVAEDDGVITGFYQIEMEMAEAHLAHLWVDPARMRQGIGRALLAHACSWAATAGMRRLLIDADPNALDFYLACGASRTGELPAPIEGQPGRVRPQLNVVLRHNNS